MGKRPSVVLDPETTTTVDGDHTDAVGTPHAGHDRTPVPGGAAAPQRIGGYPVLGTLGCGSMGTVYRCHDPGLDRTIAVKLIAPELAQDASGRERFERETRLAARLTHPNTVRVYASGASDGAPFLVMECVEGRSLQAHIDQFGPLTADEACVIAAQAARGLGAAFEAGLIHRDVKPSNILLPELGGVKVADFGLAKLVDSDAAITCDGIVLGTPHYMSPEQVQGLELDHRSDMYSLGITLHHMLSGQPPFHDGNPITIAMRHVHEPLPTLDLDGSELSARVAAVVGRLTAKDPADRFPTWDLAIDAIESATHAGVSERRTGIAPGILPTLTLLAATAVLVLAFGAVVAVMSPQPATPASPEAVTDPAPAMSAVVAPARVHAARFVPAAPAAGTAGFTRLYSRALQDDGDWLTTGRSATRGDGAEPLFSPSPRTELWNRHALNGDMVMTVRVRPPGPPEGAPLTRLVLMLRDGDTGTRYVAALGASQGDSAPERNRRWLRSGGPGPRPIERGGEPHAATPPTRLMRQSGSRRVELAETSVPILHPGELAELSLERRDGRVRLLLAGEVLLDGEVTGLGTATFGIAFPSGTDAVESVELRAALP